MLIQAALLFKQKAPASLRQDSVEAIAQTGLATKEEVSSQLLDSKQEICSRNEILIGQKCL